MPGLAARLLPWLALLALAAAPRLAQLDNVVFQGDEAQDSAMIRHMVETGQPVQAGMLNSIGTVNLPLFDYLMLPPFALSPDPRVATAYVAALNVVAVLLTFAFARRVFGDAAGIVAASMLALAPWPVLFSRKIWPPYLILPLAALCLYALVRAREGSKRAPWWAAGALAAWLWVCQLHPVALLEAPAFVLAGPRLWRQLRPGPLATGALAGVAPVAPFLLYDAGRGWESLRTYLAAPLARPVLDGDSVHWAVLNVTGLDTLQYAGIIFAKFTPHVDAFAALERLATVAFAASMAFACVACALGFRPGAGGARRERAGALLMLLGWAWLPVAMTLRHGAPVYQHYYIVQLPAAFALVGFAAASAAGWPKACASERQAGSAEERGESRARSLAAVARGGPVLLALLVVLAGWSALLVSFARYLGSGRGDAEFGLPLVRSEALGALAAKAASGGTLYAQADSLVSPMLGYWTRNVPDRRNQPTDGLVVPPSGTAGYFFGDASLLPALALERAGVPPVGRVSYLGGAREAVAFTVGSPLPTAAQLGADRPLTVRLANGVAFLAAGVTQPSGDVLRVEYAWKVSRVGVGVTDSDLAVYVHVVDSAGRTRAQRDAMPVPSSQWHLGDTTIAWLDVPLNGVAPGAYELRGGMYERPSIRRVQSVDDSGALRDGEFSLGTYAVR